MQSNRTQNDNNVTSGGGQEAREATPIFQRTAVSQGLNQPLISTPMFQASNWKLPPVSNETSKNWCVIKAPHKPIWPLERPVVIPDKPHLVSARLSDSLRLRSIQAEFKDSQAICTTSCFVEYSIDLYAEAEHTIVEVIRRRGCGFAFRKEREAILNAARGNGGDVRSKLPFVMKIPQDLLKDYQPPTQEEHQDTLNRASDELNSGKMEVQLFTLQNLSSMTTPDAASQGSAQLLAKLIMESYSDIRDLITELVKYCAQQDDLTSGQITNSCLTVFCNSMTSLSQAKTLETVLEKECQQFIEMFIPALVSIVKDCKCLHNTCLALRCLNLLLNNSSDACKKMNDEACEIVAQAESCGKARHLRLQQEAKSALAVLRCQ